MHFTKFTILAIIGLAAAVPMPNGRGGNNNDDDGDTTTTTCSNSQSTVCCDKSGKNCNIKDSCSNEQIQMCGNTVSVPIDIDTGMAKMLKRTDRNGNGDDNDGDTTTTTCSNSQSTMCCDKSGKNCEIKDSCSNSQSQICGNVIDLGGIGLRRRSGRDGNNNNDDDGDTTTTTCSNSQSTMCCDDSGKNCQVSNSCGNSQTQFCGNTVSVPVAADLGDILGRLSRRTDRNDNDDNNDGDTTTTTCSNNQSTMCCDKSGKNCEVKNSCSNSQIQVCGNSVSVPITVDAGDVTCLLSGGC